MGGAGSGRTKQLYSDTFRRQAVRIFLEQEMQGGEYSKERFAKELLGVNPNLFRFWCKKYGETVIEEIMRERR